MLGSGGLEGGDPNGESDGPLHGDDSTFGEYMAALDGRSSSGNGVRRLNSSGTASQVGKRGGGGGGEKKTKQGEKIPKVRGRDNGGGGGGGPPCHGCG